MSATVIGVRVHRPPHHDMFCIVDYPDARDYEIDGDGDLHLHREDGEMFATFVEGAWLSVETLYGPKGDGATALRAASLEVAMKAAEEAESAHEQAQQDLAETQQHAANRIAAAHRVVAHTAEKLGQARDLVGKHLVDGDAA